MHYFSLGFFCFFPQQLLSLPACGAAVPIFPTTFCLHVCGAHLVLQEPGNALCEAERRNPGAFESWVLLWACKGSAAHSSTGVWLGTHSMSVLPPMPNDFSASRDFKPWRLLSLQLKAKYHFENIMGLVGQSSKTRNVMGGDKPLKPKLLM